MFFFNIINIYLFFVLPCNSQSFIQNQPERVVFYNQDDSRIPNRHNENSEQRRQVYLNTLKPV